MIRRYYLHVSGLAVGRDVPVFWASVEWVSDRGNVTTENVANPEPMATGSRLCFPNKSAAIKGAIAWFRQRSRGHDGAVLLLGGDRGVPLEVIAGPARIRKAAAKHRRAYRLGPEPSSALVAWEALFT